jgi:hypothetical protein
MKEIQPLIADELEVSVVKPIKTDVKLIGRLKPKPGQTCFKLNLCTGEVSIATFESKDIHYSKIVKGDMVVRNKLLVEKDCIYTTALNKFNAIKHFRRILKPLINNQTNK